MRQIQSVQNQYIKAAKQLQQKKYREKSGLFLLEGIRLVTEAVNVDYPLEFALAVKDIDPGLVEKLSGKCSTFLVSHELLSVVTETEQPQGIVAVGRQRKSSLSQLTLFAQGLLMVVDGVQDPGNLGTIIRTADAAGAGGVIMTQNTVDVFNSKTVRSSMGSILKTNLVPERSPKEVVEWLSGNGWAIIVGHVGAERFYFEIDYSGRVAVVVGNENQGPCREFIDNGQLVKIPCRTESLNVSIASAILLYEKVRKGYDSIEGEKFE